MTAISVSEITTNSLTGTGVFDQMMSTIQLRLEEEFDAGRLTGTDYANVYLGSMTASMQQAVTFVLGRQASDSQAELLKAQALESTAKIANINADTVNKGKQGLVLDNQALEIATKAANINADTSLKGKQELLIAKQILESQAKIDNAYEDIVIKGKQGLLTEQQILEIAAKIANLDSDTVNKGKQGTLIDGQVAKASAEELLLKNKSVTEQAQRSDTVTDVDGTPNVLVGGVIGSKRVLYSAQAVGFKDDAKIKAAKVAADVVNVFQTVSGTGVAAGPNMGEMAAMINNAKIV